MPTVDSTELRSEVWGAEIGSLFDFLGDVQFWEKDSDGRYLRVNRAFQLNYSLVSIEAVRGLTDFDLSPPWLAEQFQADDERVLRGERIVNRVELVGGFDRTARWFRTSKIPLHDVDGQVVATAGITQVLPDLGTPQFPLPELAKALSAIQAEPTRPWRNVDLAKMTGLSVSAFERRFRKCLHTSPTQFLKRLRLARSAAFLIETGKPVAEIALETGFSDQAHLSREFKKLFSVSPTEWRSRHFSGNGRV